MRQADSGAWVDDVRVANPTNLDELFRVSRRRHGRIRDDDLGWSGVGARDGDPPAGLAGRRAARDDLATD